MQQIARKIIQIRPEARVWGDDRNGNGRAAEVGFVLETTEGVREFGEYRSTESSWGKVIERATPSVGQVFTFDAEAANPYEGVTQWKLRSYPGKPEAKPGGGGGGKAGGRGDWETAGERADRRLNDAASKVLGVAAVMVGEDGPGVDRAAALVAITPAVADAFLAARELLAPAFPVIQAPAPPAPASGPQDSGKPASDQTWGPAPKAEATQDDATPEEREAAWDQLAEATGSPGAALMAVNRHFDRKSNRDAYTRAQVLEVLAALSPHLEGER